LKFNVDFELLFGAMSCGHDPVIVNQRSATHDHAISYHYLPWPI